MEPGKVYKVTLQPMTTSNYFEAGHRIRIEVSSSNFPRFDRNMNTGGKNYDEVQGRRRAQRRSPLEAVSVADEDHGGEAVADAPFGDRKSVTGTNCMVKAAKRLGVLPRNWSLSPNFGLVAVKGTKLAPASLGAEPHDRDCQSVCHNHD